MVGSGVGEDVAFDSGFGAGVPVFVSETGVSVPAGAVAVAAGIAGTLQATSNAASRN